MKKGVSGVIIAMLLVMISIVAVLIIYNSSRLLVKKSSSQLNTDVLTSEIEFKEALFNPYSQTVEILVYRPAGVVNLVGIKFIFYNDASSWIYEERNNLPLELETKRYLIYVGTNITNIKNVSVALIVSAGGQEAVSMIKDSENVIISGNITSEISGVQYCNGADVNKDGVIDGLDYTIWADNSNNVEVCLMDNNWCDGADITGDGIVDEDDKSILMGNYGKTCSEAKECYVLLEINENNNSGISEFNLASISSVFGGIYENFVTSYFTESDADYILEAYNASGNLLKDYAVFSSIKPIHSDSGIITSVIHYDSQIASIKINNEGIPTDLGIDPSKLYCKQRECKIEGEYGLIGRDECCNGFQKVELDSSNFACTNCGDGICSQYENESNCFEDCYNFTCPEGQTDFGKICVDTSWCNNADVNKGGEVDDLDKARITMRLGDENCSDTYYCNGADVNRDGNVDESDVDLVLAYSNFGGNLGANGCDYPDWCNDTDINQDGVVDLTDYNLVNDSLGMQNCIPNYWCDGADVDRDGIVDDADVGILDNNENGRTDCGGDIRRFDSIYYLTCPDYLCQNPRILFELADNNVFIRVFDSDNANLTGNLTLPDNSQIELVFEDNVSDVSIPQIGVYSAEVTAYKKGYEQITNTIEFEVVEKRPVIAGDCDYDGVCDTGENYGNCFQDCTYDGGDGNGLYVDWCQGADFNRDGRVDVDDLGILATNYYTADESPKHGDANLDRKADDADKETVISFYDMNCNGNKACERADFSNDGKVNVDDLGILSSNFGWPAIYSLLEGDATGDGIVNVDDLGILASNYDREDCNLSYSDLVLIGKSPVTGNAVLKYDTKINLKKPGFWAKTKGRIMLQAYKWGWIKDKVKKT